MIILAFTIAICLVTVAIMVVGTIRHGWTNFYLVSIGLVLVSLAFGVLGYLG